MKQQARQPRSSVVRKQHSRGSQLGVEKKTVCRDVTFSPKREVYSLASQVYPTLLSKKKREVFDKVERKHELVFFLLAEADVVLVHEFVR